jgi:cytochrome P450 / NADPH-cytochrome P450 reductase
MRHPYEDTIIGCKYRMQKDTSATALIAMLHRDRQIGGDNPEAFARIVSIPRTGLRHRQNAYKSSGRAYIGRQFAMQEAILVLNMLLQRFEFADFSNCQLETKQTLTINPDNFHIRVKLRAQRAVLPRSPRPLSRAARDRPHTASACLDLAVKGFLLSAM